MENVANAMSEEDAEKHDGTGSPGNNGNNPPGIPRRRQSFGASVASANQGPGNDKEKLENLNDPEKAGNSNEKEKWGNFNDEEKARNASGKEKAGKSNEIEKAGNSNEKEKAGNASEKEKAGNSNEIEKAGNASGKEKAENSNEKEKAGNSNNEKEKAGNSNENQPSKDNEDKGKLRKKIFGRMERTIPGMDALTVRYVKMRHDKKADAVEPEEMAAEVAKMREKVLEGVLGVKAERKEGERWVKLSETEVENLGEITKRIDDVEKLTKTLEGKEEISRMESSSHSVGSRIARTGNLVRKDCISLAKEIRTRRKEKRASLKYRLEKRVGSVERVIEDQVEKILDGTAEKYPWLQPIETWFVDRYKSVRGPGNLRKESQYSSTDSEIYKDAKEEDDDEKVVKETRKMEGEESCEEIDDREIFIETAKKSSKKKNESFLHSTSSLESSPDSGKDNEKQEMKIVKSEKIEKHYGGDLFDKLRDGFKEKVEDVQRVFVFLFDLKISFFFLSKISKIDKYRKPRIGQIRNKTRFWCHACYM